MTRSHEVPAWEYERAVDAWAEIVREAMYGAATPHPEEMQAVRELATSIVDQLEPAGAAAVLAKTPAAPSMTQVAPVPAELYDLVAKCSYRAHQGWSVSLEPDCERDRDSEGKVIGHGLTLAIWTKGYDSYNPERGTGYRVVHYFIVPAATYNRDAWQRWLFDQFAKVEMHECMEHFTIARPDLCRHCGQADEPGGDHSCTCPNADDDCAEHGEVWRERPFAPLHGPGCDPYTVHQLATDEQRRTNFRGQVQA